MKILCSHPFSGLLIKSPTCDTEWVKLILKNGELGNPSLSEQKNAL